MLGVDYACRAYKYLGFIQIEKILRREDAIKARWIGDKYDTDTASPEAVEMPGPDAAWERDVSFSNLYYDSSSLDAARSPAGTVNPLLKATK